MTSEKLLEVVTKRSAVIDCLADDITDKREIEAELDISRQTVGRALNELESVGVVRFRSGYELTLLGELAYRKYAELVVLYESLSSAAPILTLLQAGSRIDRRLFDGADVELVDPELPYGPIATMEERIRTSDRVVAYFPRIFPQTLGVVENLVSSERINCELFFEWGLVEKLLGRHEEAVETLIDSKNSTVSEVKDGFPFGFALLDDEAWVCVFDGEGGIRGTISSESASAIEWATELFEYCQNRATTLSWYEVEARPE